jgi:carbon-monoxide dehydrogenase medium subunit
MLPVAVAHIGHQQTRNRGTVGGSVCHLDPGAELPVVAAALDAKMIVAGGCSVRALSMSEFALDYLTNQLAADELLAAIEFPKLKPRTGVAFEEFARRPADLAVVSVASVVRLNAGSEIEKISVAIGGLGAGPVRLRRLEKMSVGMRFDDDFLRMAADCAREEPAFGQGEYSSEYRSHLAAVLCGRSLGNAFQRVR